jgi:hypothetical protein
VRSEGKRVVREEAEGRRQKAGIENLVLFTFIPSPHPAGTPKAPPPHFSLLTPHFSLLTSHFSLLTSHSSPLTSHSPHP